MHPDASSAAIGQSRSRGSWRICVFLEGHRRGGETRAYRGQAHAATKWGGSPQGHSVWSGHWVLGKQPGFVPQCVLPGPFWANRRTCSDPPHGCSPCHIHASKKACSVHARAWPPPVKSHAGPAIRPASDCPSRSLSLHQRLAYASPASPCNPLALAPDHVGWLTPRCRGRETPFHHRTATRRLSMSTMLLG